MLSPGSSTLPRIRLTRARETHGRLAGEGGGLVQALLLPRKVSREVVEIHLA